MHIASHRVNTRCIAKVAIGRDMDDMHSRLKTARVNAGFSTATAAAERLGVPVATYRSHENGSRGYPRDAAAHYARAFRVAPTWLLYGNGDGPAATGMAEPAVAPFVPPTQIAFAETDPIMAAAQAAQRANLSLFKVMAPNAELALMSGDLLAVDLSARRNDAQIAVVTYADSQTGHAVTALRRVAFGRIVPPLDASGPTEDSHDAVTLGHVRHVFRTT